MAFERIEPESSWRSNYTGISAIPYGFLWNTASSSPTLTRCDENGDSLTLTSSDFDNHPLWGNIRRCQLTKLGDNWQAAYGSNARGDGLTTTTNYMMTEIPRAHVITWDDGDYHGWCLADAPFVGYPTGTEISSVGHPWFNQRGNSSAPLERGYVGCYKGCATDTSNNNTGTLQSRSGVTPSGSITQANFEAKANNIGTKWGITNVWYQSLLQLLMYTEFGNLNIQSALAPGFTKSTNTAPQTTGVHDNLMGTNGTGGGTDVQGVNYRGINNPYGDIWEHRIGWNSTDAEYRVVKRDGTGTMQVELTTGNYEATSGITPLQNTTGNTGGGTTHVNGYTHGYVKTITRADPLKLLMVAHGSQALTGSDTTYACDYFYSHSKTSPAQKGCLLAGGGWNGAGSAGPGFLHSSSALSIVDAALGARLEYLGVVI